jgi:hypothetical protein
MRLLGKCGARKHRDNAKSGQHQLRVQRFHNAFSIYVARAAYLRKILHCTRAKPSLGNHDIFNEYHALMGIFRKTLGCLYCDATRTKTRRNNSVVETTDCVMDWQPLPAHARCSRSVNRSIPPNRKFSVAEIALQCLRRIALCLRSQLFCYFPAICTGGDRVP